MTRLTTGDDLKNNPAVTLGFLNMPGDIAGMFAYERLIASSTIVKNGSFNQIVMTDAHGYSTTFDFQRENGLVPYVGTVVNGVGTFSCDFTYTETGKFASEAYHTPASDSPVTFSYDENGDLLGDEGRSIIYDQCHFDENEYLLNTLGRDLPDGCTFIFQYDEGHIVKVQQDWGGGTPDDMTLSY